MGHKRKYRITALGFAVIALIAYAGFSTALPPAAYAETAPAPAASSLYASAPPNATLNMIGPLMSGLTSALTNLASSNHTAFDYIMQALQMLLNVLNGASMPTAPPPTPAPTVSISVSPALITQGQTTTLTWTSTNATACTAYGGWTGAKALNGSETVTPTVVASFIGNRANPRGGTAGNTATYALTCTGGGGSQTGSATVTVAPSSAAAASATPAIAVGTAAPIWRY